MLKNGSHVSMNGKEMLLGSVKEALSYKANTFMFYTGAPQNTFRKPVSALRKEEAFALMKEAGIKPSDVVVHAPYIINLANSVKPETYQLAVDFLAQEIERCEALEMTRLVLHPGSHVKAGAEIGIEKIIDGLNKVIKEDMTVKIALETMAGKGSEVGRSFDEIQQILAALKYPNHVGICLDTCHLHDAGYDLNDFDAILKEVDEKIGLDKILVVHINDSKNPRGAHKDRHENIGYGYIGFDTLAKIVHHPLLDDVPKILETPYVNEQAPYELEIEMLRKKTFIEGLKER